MKLFFFIVCIVCSGQLMAQWTERIITSNTQGGPLQVVVGDIDNDGKIDVLNVNNFPAQNFVWYRNINNNGDFEAAQEIGSIYEPRNMAIGDIDGDGDLDVIGASPYNIPPYLVYYKNMDGLGNFGTLIEVSTPNTQGQRAIIVTDIDGDGHNDLVVGSITDRALTWYKNLDGNGSFDEGNIIISNYVNGSGIAVGDIDGDGDIDIVAGSLMSDTMSWFENLDGNGTFGPPQEIGSSGSTMLSVFLVDIDGDNDLDVIGSSVGSGVFAWWENLDGLGNFSLEKTIDASLVTTYIYPVDLDNDGDIDVLTLAPGYLRWYENLDGFGNFGSANIIKDDLEFAITVTAADLDNDGDMDPIAASQSDYTIYWFENDLLSTDQFSLQKVKIHPNPTKDILHINTDENIKSVMLFDVLGRKVYQQDGNKKEVNLTNFQNGIYFIRITTDSGSLVQKVIKE